MNMENMFRKWIQIVEGILEEYFDFEKTCQEVLDMARAGNKIYALEEELPLLWDWLDQQYYLTQEEMLRFADRLHRLKQEIYNAY